jgi:ADP-ribose pyrophosphatase
MEPWKTLSRKTVFERLPYLRVEEHVILLPDGKIINDWTYVITPDFVIVSVITTSGKWLCFRQPKYATEGLTLAPVGGYIKDVEAPLDAAKRELEEETGFVAPDWKFLGKYTVDANRGKAHGFLYLAKNGEKVSTINSDDLEEQEILFLDRYEVEKSVKRGDFKEMSFQTTMALALLSTE